MTQDKIAGFIAALGDGRDGVREFAIARLVDIGDKAAPALIAKLNSPDAFIQEVAAYVLAQIGQPAVPYLQAALKDSDRKIRWNAAAVLGIINGEQTQPDGPPKKKVS